LYPLFNFYFRWSQNMIRLATLAATVSIFSIIPASAATDALSTIAERSAFQKTGRYDEVIQLCAAYQKAYPKAVRCQEFGRTPEGRPMMALIATRTGAFTSAEAVKRNIPVLLVQGGIHAGEIDGKDAGFLALRGALDDTAAKGALDKQVLIFVPVFNIDGHERFGKWNRPNQIGPEEMGWRTTAQNFNLNRDYAKADSPEMQAMLRLVNEWDPIAYIDLHVTDGAKFEHDIAIMVEPVHGGDVDLRKAGKALRDTTISDLATQGSLPLPFYPSFVVGDDPSTGFTDSVSPPRFSTGYFLTRNRLGMLVETHSWKDYATRVRGTRNTVISILSQIATNGQEWMKLAKAADARAAKVAGEPVALTYKATDKSRTIDFRGYEYTRTMSDVSGALMTRYDEKKPQIWKLAVRDDVQPDLKVTAPRGGYIVAAAHAAWVGEKLAQHGIAFRKLTKPLINAATETFRADTTKLGADSVESHQRMNVQGAWKAETREIKAGSLFVPIAQAKSLLVMSLFEPLAPDSFVAWGAFNNAFERKEYMEAYVAEDVAREQLAADPALAVAFKNKLATDAEFAKNPAARLEFFARRHSSWDEQFNLYPVMRIGSVPAQ
jgi:murein tripeptide amidase MpaA